MDFRTQRDFFDVLAADKTDHPKATSSAMALPLHQAGQNELGIPTKKKHTQKICAKDNSVFHHKTPPRL